MAKELGTQEVVKQLVNEGVSTRAAEKLVRGTYPSEPKSIKDKLLSVLHRNGFPRSEAS